MELQEKDKIDQYLIFLAKNPRPEAIQFVRQHSRIKNLKANITTTRVTILTAFKEKLSKSLAENPTRNAMKLMESIWIQLNLLSTNDESINYESLSQVLSEDILMKLFVNPEAMKYISKILPLNSDLYSNIIQGNPNPKAFQFLESNNYNYNYYFLSENPSSKAIKILKKRMEEEKSISKEVYYNLRNMYGPVIFLNWISISKNPKAKSLILAKIKDENGKKQEIAEDIKNGYYERNLNWDYVSANPAIFKCKRTNTDDIAKYEEKYKKIELYLHPPNTENDQYLILRSEINAVFSDDNITNNIISQLNIGSIYELINTNPIKFAVKLRSIFPENNSQRDQQILKLKKLIEDLKIKYSKPNNESYLHV